MLTSQDFKKIEKQASKIYSGLELEIIQEIAERIANVGYANTVVYNNAVILQEMGVLYEEVINMVAEYNETSASQVRNIFETAGVKSLKRDDTIYKMAGLNPQGLNTSMQQILGATAIKTQNNLSRLTQTTAITSQTQFIEAMNKAYMEVSTGVKSYSQSIIDAVKAISNQGAYIEYPSGQHRSIEAATRMNILTSVNQMSGRLQLMRADEMGWDLMELSAHSGARPEHAEWQGKVVSLSGQKGYLSLDDIGYGEATGFQGVNCRHTWFPYYKGSTFTYSNKELRDLKNETAEYNGKKISKYEAMQIQRKMERQIRQNKKEIASYQGILTSNNKDDKLMEDTRISLANTQMKLKQNNSILNDFVEQTGLKKDNTRLSIGKNIQNEELNIAEPLNKLIKTLPKQQTTKKIIKLVDEYDSNKKIKVDYLSDKPFKYSKSLNKILVNPNHPDFNDYNIREAITHEISHMIDIDNGMSLNKDRRKEVNDLKDIILSRKDEFNDILDKEEYSNNIFISDLFAGITKGEVRGNWGHPSSYWNDENNRYSEIISNIETIYLKKDDKSIKLIKTIPEFESLFKRVVKEYGNFI